MKTSSCKSTAHQGWRKEMQWKPSRITRTDGVAQRQNGWQIKLWSDTGSSFVGSCGLSLQVFPGMFKGIC